MSHELEFERLDLATEARDIASKWLADEDDRRRTKIVVSRSIPGDVLSLLEWREYRAMPDRRAGQLPLSAGERDRITLPRTAAGGANVFHARSCKAIAQMLAVSDWISYYDRTLTVDEHFDVFESARNDVPRSKIPSFMRA